MPGCIRSPHRILSTGLLLYFFLLGGSQAGVQGFRAKFQKRQPTFKEIQSQNGTGHVFSLLGQFDHAANSVGIKRYVFDALGETFNLMQEEELRIWNHPDELWNHPDELCAVLFMVFSLLCSVYVLFNDFLVARSVDMLIRKQSEMTNRYKVAEAFLTAELNRLEASPAMRVEQQFKEFAQGFQRFLEGVARCSKERSGDSEESAELLRLFRRFVFLWLRAFEPCCVEPLTEPRRVIREAELSACGNIHQVARLTWRRMAHHPIHLVSDTWSGVTGAPDPLAGCSDLDAVQNVFWVHCAYKFEFDWHRSSGFNEETKGWPIEVSLGCIVLTLFSWAHVRLLLGIAVGAALVPLMLMSSKFALAAGVAIAEVLLMLVLLAIGFVTARYQLKACIDHVREQQHLAEEKKHTIEETCGLVESAAPLWLYRTVPLLALFKHLSEQIDDSSGDEKARIYSPTKLAFLKGIVEMLDKLDASMGDLWIWAGTQATAEDLLKAVGQELGDASDFVSKSRAQEDAQALVIDRLSKANVVATAKLVSSSGKHRRRVTCCPKTKQGPSPS